MVAFALLPVVRATRLDLSGVLADGGRASTGGVHGSRTRSTLVVVEVAIAIALLTAAALFTQSVRNMLRGDPGVRVDHALVMHLSLPSGLTDSAASDVYRRLDENLHATPGVRAAGRHEHDAAEQQFLGRHVRDSRAAARARRPSIERERPAHHAGLCRARRACASLPAG